MVAPNPLSSGSLADIDLSTRECFSSGVPHALFSLLRAEAPVWRHPPTPGLRALVGERPLWIVSTHSAVQAVSRDEQTFTAVHGPSIPLQDLSPRGESWEGKSLVTTDGPAHSRLRNLINRGFTPRMVATLEEQIGLWSARIVDDVVERGECNFVADVAKELPMQLFADMLGVPNEERSQLFALVDGMMSAADPANDVTPDEHRSFIWQIFEYGQALSEQRRTNPGEDLWSKVACAEFESAEGDPRLSDWELQLFFHVLLAAGAETTQNAIAEGLLTFLENPDQLNLFRDEPSTRETAAQEVIRWTSPLRYWARTATRDTDLVGQSIHAGDRVSVWFGSANRDESVFEKPDTFDIRRSPNPHCAFGGGGQHYCLGSHLAAREVRVIFETLFARVREIELLEPPHWSVPGLSNNISCSLDQIRVRLHPA